MTPLDALPLPFLHPLDLSFVLSPNLNHQKHSYAPSFDSPSRSLPSTPIPSSFNHHDTKPSTSSLDIPNLASETPKQRRNSFPLSHQELRFKFDINESKTEDWFLPKNRQHQLADSYYFSIETPHHDNNIPSPPLSIAQFSETGRDSDSDSLTPSFPSSSSSSSLSSCREPSIPVFLTSPNNQSKKLRLSRASRTTFGSFPKEKKDKEIGIGREDKTDWDPFAGSTSDHPELGRKESNSSFSSASSKIGFGENTKEEKNKGEKVDREGDGGSKERSESVEVESPGPLENPTPTNNGLSAPPSPARVSSKPRSFVQIPFRPLEPAPFISGPSSQNPRGITSRPITPTPIAGPEPEPGSSQSSQPADPPLEPLSFPQPQPKPKSFETPAPPPEVASHPLEPPLVRTKKPKSSKSPSPPLPPLDPVLPPYLPETKKPKSINSSLREDPIEFKVRGIEMASPDNGGAPPAGPNKFSHHLYHSLPSLLTFCSTILLLFAILLPDPAFEHSTGLMRFSVSSPSSSTTTVPRNSNNAVDGGSAFSAETPRSSSTPSISPVGDSSSNENDLGQTNDESSFSNSGKQSIEKRWIPGRSPDLRMDIALDRELGPSTSMLAGVSSVSSKGSKSRAWLANSGARSGHMNSNMKMRKEVKRPITGEGYRKGRGKKRLGLSGVDRDREIYRRGLDLENHNDDEMVSELESAKRDGNTEESNIQHFQTLASSSSSNNRSTFLTIGVLGTCFRTVSTQADTKKDDDHGIKCTSTSVVPYFIRPYALFGLPITGISTNSNNTGNLAALDANNDSLRLPTTLPLLPLLLITTLVFSALSFSLFLMASLPFHAPSKSSPYATTPSNFFQNLLAQHRLTAKRAVMVCVVGLTIGLISTVVVRVHFGGVVDRFNDQAGQGGIGSEGLDKAELGVAWNLFWASWGLMGGAVAIGALVIGRDR